MIASIVLSVYVGVGLLLAHLFITKALPKMQQDEKNSVAMEKLEMIENAIGTKKFKATLYLIGMLIAPMIVLFKTSIRFKTNNFSLKNLFRPKITVEMKIDDKSK